MKEISVSFTKLNRIIHLADVHVRLVKRHAEYRECFATLYDHLRTTAQVGDIIFVGGDLCHAKTDMSPEMVALASDFLNTLASISPTIVIAGNHDHSASNPSRLDAISPIVDNLQNPNLHYLKDSGVYRLADVDFAVYSTIGSSKDWPTLADSTAETKVALFHGPVNNAETETGYTVANRAITLSMFDGYDMVLLGDIHKKQIMQMYDARKKLPTVAYPGSLIQQSYGETLGDHGWCEWNVDTRQVQFRELENSYGYYTLVLKDNRLPILPDLPKNIRLRIFLDNSNSTTAKKTLAILRKKYAVEEFVINRMASVVSSQSSPVSIGDVHSVDTQNHLIREFLETHFSIDDKALIDTIFELNKKLNSKLGTEDFTRNVHWKPIRFEFSNMFSYGPNNIVNFEALKGSYGIFAPNASGKSSTFDALMFCLYDKTPRAFKASYIMNNRKNKFECMLTFRVGDQEYGIRRMGQRKKDGEVKVDVDFWQVRPDGSLLSLNGDDRRDTNAIIRSYVGSYEDFILTNLSVQNNSSLFIDKGQSERKDLLAQFMGLDVFDKLCTMASDEIKEVVGALKKFGKEDFSKTLADVQLHIEEKTLLYDVETTKLRNFKEQEDQVQKQITSLYESKVPIDPTFVDIDRLQQTKRNLLQSIAKTKEELQQSSLLLKRHEDMRKTEQAALLSLTNSGIERRYSEYTKATKKKSTIDAELRVIGVTVKNHEEKLKKLSEHKYDPNCEFCMNNVFVKDAIATKNQLFIDEQSRNRLLQSLSETTDQMAAVGDVEAQYDDYRSLNEKIGRLNVDIQSNLTQMESKKVSVAKAEASLKETDLLIQKYHDSIDIIQKNAEIDTEIFSTEQTKKQIGASIDLFETNLRGLHGELQVLKTTKADILASIQEAEELEKYHHAYEYYIEAIKRDGVPYELITKVIPSIEAEVNNILSQIVDFTIALDIDGKNINGKIVYDDDRIWPLEMSSGMERFISSLAIRVALINVSNLPKANFLIIDEGLGTLSAENLMAMNMLFSILKNMFDFIVVISHLDSVRDMVDNLIDLRWNNGFSQIVA